MAIPLVDDNGKNSINTSVIAIRKEIEQINSLLQNLNNKLKSLSDNDFLYRSDLADTVTVGDNQPVTSNAVAYKINSLDVSSVGGSGKYISAISETDGKINATATDLGNMVPVDTVTSGDMHSVTSNAVANILKNLVEQSNSLPTDANTFLSGTFVRIYQERKSANSLSHYPSLTNYSSAGGMPAWCLFHFQVDSGRIVQICTVQYYNTSSVWKNELFCRQKIDNTWFGWKSLHSLSN